MSFGTSGEWCDPLCLNLNAHHPRKPNLTHQARRSYMRTVNPTRKCPNEHEPTFSIDASTRPSVNIAYLTDPTATKPSS
eukprot:4502659-Pyramimonas_sp.AAC.1